MVSYFLTHIAYLRTVEVLFSDLQIAAPKQYGSSLMLPKNNSVSMWVKVESDKKALKQKKSCRIFHSPVDTRSSNSVHPNCSSNGLLGGPDTELIRSSWSMPTTILMIQRICN